MDGNVAGIADGPVAPTVYSEARTVSDSCVVPVLNVADVCAGTSRCGVRVPDESVEVLAVMICELEVWPLTSTSVDAVSSFVSTTSGTLTWAFHASVGKVRCTRGKPWVT